MSTAMKRRLYTPDMVMPAKTLLARDGSLRSAAPGMEMVDLLDLGIMPGVGGGDRGYNARGDLITATANNVDLNDLWDDYQRMLADANSRRDALVSFLTWRTTNVSENRFTTGQLADFEEASEYGEPVGIRPGLAGEVYGYTFKWYDLAARFTWQFLADATSDQVDAISNMAVEADNRLVFTTVLKTLFNNSRRTNKEGVTVYPFYAGVAGDLPPVYGATTFADSHNHYVTSGTASITAPALESLIGLLTEHGYRVSNGYDIVLMINPNIEGTIRNFRSTANGGTGTYDFVPAQGTPSFLLPTTLRIEDGQTRPPATLRGMEVVGAYGPATIVKNDFVPAGYIPAFVTGGDENILNPIAIREHPQQSLRGLRLVKGRTPDYPLIDSFYNRGFGTGVRSRGAGAVMQITTSGTYAVPSQYVW